MGFTVVFIYKGAFVKDPNLNYKGGEIAAFKNIDEDTWSYFEAIGLTQQVDPNVEAANVRLWWKPSNGSLEDDLKALSVDKDAIELCNYAVSKNTEVDIYVEYNVNKGSEVSESSNDEDTGSSDDDSVSGIHFDDSEEERVGGLDDGFDEVPNEVVLDLSTEVLVDEPVEVPSLGSNSKKTKTYEVLVNPVDDAMHTIDDEYLTDELDSASDTSTEGYHRPKTERFNPDYMSKDFKFTVGMEFSSLKQFKDAIMEHNVLNGREVKYAKNDSVRVRVVHKFKQICGYTILVSREGRTTTYRVKTLWDKHTCGRVFANKSAKTNWVVKEMVEKLKNNPKVKINEVIAHFRTQFSTEITFSRAFKARQIAREIVEGDCSKQYALLWSYSAELQRASPGNTCKLQLERPSLNLQPRFGRYYICFDRCKKALKTACRPFIGLDGCHLKNKYGGQLLIVVGRDPNDQYLPLAFAVVETETKDTWTWFLTLLLEDIGDATTNRWTFISDQQKGLIATFEELLGGTEHRFCLRHLYANFKKKFGRGTMMRDLMMAAAKATYFEAWEEKMLQLKELDAKAYEWLTAVPTKQWCKHAFPFYSRCDVLMNNLSESFNATILLQRDKPIITMFEWVRTYLMGRFATLREKVSKHKGDVMPKPRKRLDREIEMSGNWFATYAGELKFEVTHSLFTEKFVVDLQKHSCTCNFWELVGIPCRHAVAAIHRKEDDPAKYVHRYYNRETYINCYNQLITPINGQNKWPKTDYPEVLPHQYKRGPGRPKKLRRREPNKPRYNAKWKRTHTTNRCKSCLKYGHNARTCKNPQVDSLDAQTETNLDGEQPATQDVPTQASQSAAAPKKRGRPKGKSQVIAKPSEPSKKKTTRGKNSCNTSKNGGGVNLMSQNQTNQATAVTEVQTEAVTEVQTDAVTEMQSLVGDAGPLENAGAEKSS